MDKKEKELINTELDRLSNCINDLSRTYNLKIELEETEVQYCDNKHIDRTYKLFGVIPEERI